MKKLHSWKYFYTTAGRDGRDKFQVWWWWWSKSLIRMQTMACIVHALAGSSHLLLLHCELNDQPWVGDWPNSGIVAPPGLDSRAPGPCCCCCDTSTTRYSCPPPSFWPFQLKKEIIARSPTMTFMAWQGSLRLGHTSSTADPEATKVR